MQAEKLPLKDLEEWPIFKQLREDERVKQIMSSERAKAIPTVTLTSDDVAANSETALKTVEEISKGTIH